MRRNDGYVQVPAASGSKSIRLRPGVRIGDVAAVEGEVRLRLPSGIEIIQLSAPFAGQAIDAPGVRIKFADSGKDGIQYEISGQTDRILAVRALNESNQYLRRGMSFASGRLMGPGKTVGVQFAGEPAFVEVVLAREDVSRDYAFSLEEVAPRFDRWDVPKPYAVATTTKKEFQRQMRKADLRKACGGQKPLRKLSPFACAPCP